MALNDARISVVVPVYNGGASFHRCLLSLRRLQPAPSEIIVVSDGDTDGSWRLAKKFGVRVIRSASRGGPSRARNCGASYAKGNILFFIDADVTVQTDAIDRITQVFALEPAVAALFGSYDDQPGDETFLSQYRNLLHHFVHQHARENASTFWSGCGAIRREVFLTMGGFDERYREPSIEDIEIGYRLKKAGHTIRLCKTLQVKHLKRWNASSMLKADIFQRALPWTELIYRDRMFVNDLNTGLAGRASVVLTFGLVGMLACVTWIPALVPLAVVAGALLILLNARLYGFFWRKRGLMFAARAVPWHWLYFLYGGAAFAVGTTRHLFVSRNALKQPVPGFPARPVHPLPQEQEER